VAYPIFDLKPDRCDVRRYVADLARVMIGLAADHGVCAASLDAGSKYVGVWVDADAPHAAFDLDEQSLRGRNIRKIGAIGVRISRWVTLHGFAFNGTVNLSHYDLITPCGIREYGVTSLKALGVTSIPEGTSGVEMLAHRAIVHIARVFDAEATYVDPKELWSAAGLEPPPTNT
jgi:lipoyl(octanoyl) transferase